MYWLRVYEVGFGLGFVYKVVEFFGRYEVYLVRRFFRGLFVVFNVDLCLFGSNFFYVCFFIFIRRLKKREKEEDCV